MMMLPCAGLLAMALAAQDAPAEPTTKPPGVVVKHIPASTRSYLGSPALAVTKDGTYVASHDIFGPGSTRDRTFVYRSADRGKTWEPQAELVGQWWSSLFEHRGSLYLLGTSKEYGHLVIRRSGDGGKTWTEPRDKSTGLLRSDGRYHCAPVPVVFHEGRIWRATEDAMGPGTWGTCFRAFVMSAPEDADLLDASAWTYTNVIERDPSWLDKRFGGWLEGNAIVAPGGKLVNMLRVDLNDPDEKAAILDVNEGGRTLSFDPEEDFVPFPGGGKKFTIRPDPKGGGYWTLANAVHPDDRNSKPQQVRNSLALMHSPDLKSWTMRAVLLRHPERKHHGFQYVDWLYEGDDLIALVRTAFDDGQGGAHNAHDSNFITFHRFPNFRELAGGWEKP